MKDEYKTLRELAYERKALLDKMDKTLQSMRASIDARKQFDAEDLERQAAQRDQTTIKGRKVA